MNLREHLEKGFWEYLEENEDIEIYNEFSLQHELGIYLRDNFNDCHVQFERNIDYFDEYLINEEPVKKEIDIVIFNKDKSSCHAIEIKYPQNKRYPLTMYDCIKDIKFMEQLKTAGFESTFCITIVNRNDDNKSYLFYKGNHKKGIYKYFRSGQPIDEPVAIPVGNKKGKEHIKLNYPNYKIDWNDDYINRDWMKYIIETKKI